MAGIQKFPKSERKCIFSYLIRGVGNFDSWLCLENILLLLSASAVIKNTYTGKRSTLFQLLKKISFSYKTDDDRRNLIEKANVRNLFLTFLRNHIRGPPKDLHRWHVNISKSTRKSWLVSCNKWQSTHKNKKL